MISFYYSRQYAAAGYKFDTTRKAQWVAGSLTADPVPGVDLVPPDPLTEDEIAAVHDPEYVRAVRTGEPRHLAESQGFEWDAGLWTAVAASNGGAVAAARAARKSGVAGSLSSGLHHAAHARGRGFCTFNGLALAAKSALDDGAESVLILDLDAHCGGGTVGLVAGDRRIHHADVSVNSFDGYEPTPRAQLEIVRDPADYLPAVHRALESSDAAAFSLCLYNAGMDPFEDCDTGGLRGITYDILAEREYLVFDWCRRRGLPVAFVLAGGYVGHRLDETGLVRLHRLTVAAAAGQ